MIIPHGKEKKYASFLICFIVAMATLSIDFVVGQQEVGPLFQIDRMCSYKQRLYSQLHSCPL